MSVKFKSDLDVQGYVAPNHVVFNTNPSPVPTSQGSTYWDVDDNVIAVRLNGYIQKIGEDQFYPVKNQTGTLIPKGTSVGFAGTLGSSGRLLISPFIANGSVASTFYMGVTVEDIANGEDGKVLWFGRIRGLNTSAYNEGDVLYASTTVAGGFQTTIPQAPNNIIKVAAVVTASTTQGVIFVRPTFGSNINNDEGIRITTPTTGDILQLQSNGLWENKTLVQAGIQPTLTNPITGTGANGQVSFFNGTTTQTSDSGFVWDNTNKRLGVGTTSPNSKLHVQGSRIIVQDAPITSGVIRPSFQDIQNSSELLRLYTISGQGNGYISNPNGPLILGASAQIASLVISTGGNVGIGTTSPSQLLHVNGRALVDQFEYTRAISVSNTDLNNLTNAGFYNGTTLTNAPGAGWYYITVERYTDDANWVKQTATSFGSANTGNITWTRTRQKATWQPWKQLMDTVGTGATGTWGISITGNSATATTLQTTRTIWGQNFNGSQNVSGNLTGVGNITGTSNVIINSPTNRTVWVTPVLAAMQGESFADMGMIGVLYDRNELTNAAYRGNITINITGSGTFTDSTENKNRLVNAGGDVITIVALDPTSIVQITVDVGSNVNNYANATWQPFFQMRLAQTTAFTYPNSIAVEVSIDNTNWHSAASGWSISNFLTNTDIVQGGMWLGTRAVPTVPTTIVNWRYARFTISDFNIGTTGNFCSIAQLGMRHFAAPAARQYLNQVGGNSIWGNQLINGNIGINTTSPTFNLDIQSTSSNLRVSSSVGTNRAYAQFANTGGTFNVGLDSSTGGGLGTSAYAGVVMHYGAYPLILGTNATERVRIISTGEVGIGTTIPESNVPLTVNTNNNSFNSTLILQNSNTGTGALSQIQMRTQNTLTTPLNIQQFGSDGTGQIINQATSSLQLGTSGSVRLTIDSTGNVGIGTTTPFTRLDITSPSSETVARLNSTGGSELRMSSLTFSRIATWNATDLVFATNRIERARFLSTGNFGIGTTTPTQRLHVVGNTLISNNLTLGSNAGPTNVSRGYVNFDVPSSGSNQGGSLYAEFKSETDGDGFGVASLYMNPEDLIEIAHQDVQAPFASSYLKVSKNEIGLINSNGNGIGIGIYNPEAYVHINSNPGEGKYLRIDAPVVSTEPAPYTPVGGSNNVGDIVGNIPDNNVLGTPDYWMEIELNINGNIVLIPCYNPR